MKSISQLSIICLSMAGIFGSMPNAFAGEGGAAGAAAFTIQNGSVTGVAVAAAVGKQDAVAGAFNTPSSNSSNSPYSYYSPSQGANSAFAQGSAGTISIQNLSASSLSQVSSQNDASLGTSQVNNLNATVDINPNSNNGTAATVSSRSYYGL